MNCLELSIPPLPQFVMAGHSFWEPGTAHEKRNFKVFDLILVTKGVLYIHEEETRYTVGPGQLLVLEPGKTHWGYRTCDEPTETYYMHFVHRNQAKTMHISDIHWNIAMEQGEDSFLHPPEHVMYLPKYCDIDLKLVEGLLDKMVNNYHPFSVLNVLNLHSLMIQFMYQLQLHLYKKRRSSKSLMVSDMVIHYLNTHYLEPFDSKKLANSLYFSFDYLARCLKHHVDMTPLQYLHKIRIERAKALLIGSNMSTEEAGRSVGYDKYNYFIRIFKRYVGIPPGAFRETRSNTDQ